LVDPIFPTPLELIECESLLELFVLGTLKLILFIQQINLIFIPDLPNLSLPAYIADKAINGNKSLIF